MREGAEWTTTMDSRNLAAKLEQIEEQAQLTLEELPKHLTKERLRLIIALARFARVELAMPERAEMS
jgi:hypothetical protein